MSQESKQSVLLVDDEPALRFIMRQKLESAGYSVLEATDGEEGLATAIEERPRLVISDNNMPHMTGYDMAVEMKKRAETSGVPVLMLTGRGDRLTPEQIAQTNIRQVLGKPFSARDVLAMVERILRDEPTKS